MEEGVNCREKSDQIQASTAPRDVCGEECDDVHLKFLFVPWSRTQLCSSREFPRSCGPVRRACSS